MNKFLPVPYFPQNDNHPWGNAPGYVQCCPTSNAMLAAHLAKTMLDSARKNGYSQPEEYYISKVEACGFTAADRGNHDAHTVALERYFGIKSEWRTDLTSKEVVKSIDAGIPVVVGFQYKYSGHICIITGYYTDEGCGWFVNDPYGSRNGATDEYSYINPGYGDETGKNDRYSYGLLNQILFEPGTPNRGAWGRWVTAIGGKATGL